MCEISVIIPTHNRRDLLASVLAAISRQDYPLDRIEVIVVADACQDGTEKMVKELASSTSFNLKVLSHEARSAAATRNLGAGHACGELLIFLDDDILVNPGFIRAHADGRHPRRVVLGYSKPVLPNKPTLWGYNARLWWEDAFRAMRTPGYRFTYRDFFSGNVSMANELFRESGGFDISISGRLEDYELGFRLIKSGAQFHFEPRALGYHQEGTNQRLWLRRVRQEGVADVYIASRHPELRNSIFSSGFDTLDNWGRIRKGVLSLAFNHKQLGEILARLVMWFGEMCETLRLRGPWFHLNGALREFSYWRGVAEKIGGRDSLAAWLQEAPSPNPVAPDAPSLDLSVLPMEGDLSQILESADVKGLRVNWKGISVFTIPPNSGSESLREEHLWKFLWDNCQKEFLPALAMDWALRSDRGFS